MPTRAEFLEHLFRQSAQEATHAIAAGEVERPLGLPELARVRRTPLIRQVKANECGLACLAMIAAYHGISAGLPALRCLCTLSRDGATLKALLETAGRIGLRTRALRGESRHLGQLTLPAILHWNGNHFVVLAQVSRDPFGNCFDIHNPERRADDRRGGAVAQVHRGGA